MQQEEQVHKRFCVVRWTVPGIGGSKGSPARLVAAAAAVVVPARTTAAACRVLRPSVVPMSMKVAASPAALLLGSGSVRPSRLAAAAAAAGVRGGSGLAWTIFMVELRVCSM